MIVEEENLNFHAGKPFLILVFSSPIFTIQHVTRVKLATTSQPQRSADLIGRQFFGVTYK